MSERQSINLSEIIAENFGANAEYVEGLLSRFRSNPELVDEAWRTYFSELLGAGTASGASMQDNGRATVAAWDGSIVSANGDAQTSAPVTAAAPTPVVQSAAPAPPVPQAVPAATMKPSSTPQPASLPEGAEVVPIRGGALKIVENMETSLGVPTATSQRRVPVKVLD
ncbi:MAG TPA: hypothetical protein VGO69_06645, partial [Pyrinomonadaceae bacterium]|nr:hypothetical protein [Pyrinomonadaceae bacterium]